MPTQKGKLDRAQKSLLIIGSVIFIAWFVPAMQWPLIPFQYLYTHLHEMSHAIVALATGGHDIRIEVATDGSGLTTSFGGWQLLVSPAGYVGATVFGALVLAMSKTPAGAKRAFMGLGFVMFLGMVMWIRGDAVGFTTGLLLTLLFGWLGSRKADERTQFVAQFIGMFLALCSVQAVLTTLRIGAIASRENDAEILQHATGIPAILSAVIWTAASLVIAWLGLKWAWSGRRSV